MAIAPKTCPFRRIVDDKFKHLNEIDDDVFAFFVIN
jgi:hypothetical protein